MQMMVIEFARNVLGDQDANSGEMTAHTGHPVIDLMEEQKSVTDMGGTMRLGAYDCELVKGSRVFKAYGEEPLIKERHRHRYEFNNEYREALTEAGLIISGTSPDGTLVETVEIGDHPFYLGVQYHPEFKSRPNRAHPLFREFVKSSLEKGLK
jgi:CTP synthase